MTKLYYIDNDHVNIARGLVLNTELRNVFGTVDGVANIVTGEFRTPWEDASDYQFPPSPLIMSTVSDNAADVDIDILLVGLDDQYNIITETITLTGLTPVLTILPFFRINDTIVTRGNAIGRIEISNGGNLYSVISPGTGRDQKAVFTVPRNKSFYLERIDVFCTDANGGKAARWLNSLTFRDGRTLRVADTTFFEQMHITRITPLKYEWGTDIKFQLRSLSGAVFGSVFVEGLLIDNSGEPE